MRWKKNENRTKQIISLNIQQLPETDPLFSGYTGRVRARSLGRRHSKYVFSEGPFGCRKK